MLWISKSSSCPLNITPCGDFNPIICININPFSACGWKSSSSKQGIQHLTVTTVPQHPKLLSSLHYKRLSLKSVIVWCKASRHLDCKSSSKTSTNSKMRIQIYCSWPYQFMYHSRTSVQIPASVPKKTPTKQTKQKAFMINGESNQLFRVQP